MNTTTNPDTAAGAIASDWQTFADEVIPATATAEQTADLRNTFYAGAHRVFTRLLGVGSEDEGAGPAMLRCLDMELRAWVESLGASSDAARTSTLPPAVGIRNVHVLGAVNALGGSGATVTQGPTLANPEALQTVDELRAELHQANAELLAGSQRQHQLQSVVESMAREISNVVVPYLRGDKKGAEAALKAFVAKNVRTVDVDAASRSTH